MKALTKGNVMLEFFAKQNFNRVDMYSGGLMTGCMMFFAFIDKMITGTIISALILLVGVFISSYLQEKYNRGTNGEN